MAMRAPSGGNMETVRHALLLTRSGALAYGEATGERWARPWSVTECAPLGWGGGPSQNFGAAPLSLGLWKGKAALRARGTLPRQWAKHLHVNDKCLWRTTATVMMRQLLREATDQTGKMDLI